MQFFFLVVLLSNPKGYSSSNFTNRPSRPQSSLLLSNLFRSAQPPVAPLPPRGFEPSGELPATSGSTGLCIRAIPLLVSNSGGSRSPKRAKILVAYDLWNIRMGRRLIWATTEDLAKNRATVLSLYRQILRCLNSPDLPLTHAARLTKKADVRTIFLFGSEERSAHNIDDLIDAARYSLSVLKNGRLP